MTSQFRMEPSHPAGDNSATKTRSVSNIRLRLMTGLVLVPLMLFSTLAGGWWWTLIACGIAVLCLLEFYTLVDARCAWVAVPVTVGLLIGVTLQLPLALLALWVLGGVAAALLTADAQRTRRAVALLGGLGYITLPMALMIVLRAQPEGFLWVVLVAGIAAGTDTLAFVGGGLFGRTPLAPALSPKKTVEGAVIGVVGGVIIAGLFILVRGQLDGFTLLIALFGPLMAVIGDLLESALKRFFRVKDAHLGGVALMPGHGGVLDRADSLLLVAPFTFVVLLIGGKLM